MTFSPGVSFSDDTSQQATATRDTLHALITSAPLAGVTMGECSSTTFLIFSKAGEVRPTDAEDNDNRTLWFDEDDASLWQRGVPNVAGGSGKYHNWQTLYDSTNEDNAYDMPKGTVVVSTGRWEHSPCITANYQAVSGVLTATMEEDGTNYVRAQKFGLCEVLLEGPFKAGDLLVSSGTTGYAKSGTFTSAHNFTMGLAFGQALYSLGSVNTLATCLLFM